MTENDPMPPPATSSFIPAPVADPPTPAASATPATSAPGQPGPAGEARSETAPPSAEPPVLHCHWHPDRETMLRCTRCERPMCPKCARKHPVGWRCKECARELRSPLFVVSPARYAVATAAGLVAGTLAGALAVAIGGFWIVAFLAGAAMGTGMGEVISIAAGRKRGRGLQIVAGVTMVLGVALVGLWTGGLAGLLGVFVNLGVLIYLFLGIGAAAARLR